MRLFAAIELSPAERDRLRAVQRRFRGASGVRMSRRDNLHLTLRFFGEWPRDRLEELTAALAAIERPAGKIDLPLSGLRFLPSGRNPRVLIALAEADPRLLTLQRDIEACAQALGMAPETRAYIPHVTLARLPDPNQAVRFARQVCETECELGSIQADGFAVIESVLSPEGSRYSTIERWPFA